jgi:DNA-binding transcriptional LysR family regulator
LPNVSQAARKSGSRGTARQGLRSVILFFGATILKLKEEVGVRLLDRLGYRATPTKAGDLLYRYAKRILAVRQEAQQALDEFNGGLRGELTIGASSILRVRL